MNLVEQLGKESSEVFIPTDYSETEKKKKLLVITPSLQLQGALTVLLELLEFYDRKNVQIYVLTPENGEYCNAILNQGMVIVVRPYVACSGTYRKLLQTAFDGVFINSAACYYYVYFFLNTDVSVFWWLHETQTQLGTMRQDFLHMNLMSDNITIAGVTEAVRDGIMELFQKRIECLPMPIADCKSVEKDECKSDKVLFFMPAAYTYIKGQDVLLKAIMALPEEFNRKAEFVLCGYKLEGQNEYYEKIHKIAKLIPNVTFLDELPKEEVYKWYQKCDCVLAPSRVDATPTTIVEALMHEKICIVSDATGISKYIVDCGNGFVFPSEQEDELMKRLAVTILNIQDLAPVARAGRKIYETTFAPEVVFDKFRTLWNIF